MTPSRLTGLFLDNRFVVLLVTGLLLVAGVAVTPFEWDLEAVGLGDLPRDPVPVDAIPDLGEPQQIVFTAWPGHSPQDIEDQVTYPLTVQLLGVPGVRTVRSSSMFGVSMINVLMEDDVDFYWSRSRVLEKLASLPPGLLPDGVRPTLGPDATALGQVFWYTLEGRASDGTPTGGWSLQELRSIQDFLVGPSLASVSGISEVSSVGGFVREYQVDVDPDALRAFDVSLAAVMGAVQGSNRDVGASTIEVNGMELMVRGVGTIGSLDDLRDVVVRATEGVPLRLRDIANVQFGPALRRGILDKDGVEAVGGVAVVRYGKNPLAAIEDLGARIAEVGPGLPSKTLDDGTRSQVTVVPFYDRSGLIHETLDTLEEALTDEILITILVVLLMLFNLRASVLVAGLLPVAVLLCFVGMKLLGVDANVVALAGIAIAIGTMVDMGIVVTENIQARLAAAAEDEDPIAVIRSASAEVAGAVTTAVATTIVSFLPVFGLQAAEGRLFTPLAWTKTLALAAAVLVALALLPTVATLLFPRWSRRLSIRVPTPLRVVVTVIAAVAAGWMLAGHWAPLGPGETDLTQFGFVGVIVGLLLGGLFVFQRIYPWLLRRALASPVLALMVPAVVVILGLTSWLGAESTLRVLPDWMTAGARERFPVLEGEFMPRLEEGTWLYMPSTMPHASIGSGTEALQGIDRAMAALPEVEHAVGKLGRAESALDPAPLSMIETVVTLRPEWTEHPDGTRTRNWRDHIRTEADIWDELVRVSQRPELTSAPPLQPIETRIVMLQTGMRASLGIKVRGPDLKTIEAFGLDLKRVLDGVDRIAPGSVVADRMAGKPYLEIHPDRAAIARYGLEIDDVQRVIEVAIGGPALSRSIEGRESYAIRVRYPPERRLTPEAIERIQLTASDGVQIPLSDVARIEVTRGPQMIRSEDTFKTAYVTFGAARDPTTRRPWALTEVIASATGAIDQALAASTLTVPPGVSYRMAGTWAHKQRSDRRLGLLVPVALVLIIILLYLQFRSLAVTLMVFSGVAVAVAGGFVMIWAWGQPWFMDVSLFGHNLRDVFHMGPINLSVAVWVGFIALFGIAVDDGVLMATFLTQRFERSPPDSAPAITEAVIDAARRRVRPCLMTTATTVIALLPVLSSSGRGASIMTPMAVPAFGGMLFELVTLFVVPLLFALWAHLRSATRSP